MSSSGDESYSSGGGGGASDGDVDMVDPDVEATTSSPTATTTTTTTATTTTSTAAAAGAGGAEPAESTVVKVKSADQLSITLSPHPSLPSELTMDAASLALVGSTTRKTLSKVVNTLLSQIHGDDGEESDEGEDGEGGGYKGRPFEFLCEGRFVRSSLAKLYNSLGLPPDRSVVLEYVEALPAPDLQAAQDHDAWLSCVASVVTVAPAAGSGKRSSKRSAPAAPATLVAAGGYDSAVRLWRFVPNDEAGGSNGSGKGKGKAAAGGDSEADLSVGGELVLETAVAEHEEPVKAVAILPDSDDPARFTLYSGGKDRTLRSYTWTGSELEPQYVFSGHSDSVEAVAVQPPGAPSAPLVASAGYDFDIRLWPSQPEEADLVGPGGDAADAESTGTQKKAKKAKAALPVVRSLRNLSGHTNAVTCLAWPTAWTLCSGSMDHSVRLWDVESGVCTKIFSADTSTHAVAMKSGLIASGHSSGRVNIWDTRSSGGNAHVASKLTSHKGWVVGVSWAPGGQRLVSASLDGTVKVWDLRSTIPLYTLECHDERVFGVNWAQSGLISSVGADSKIYAHSISGIGGTGTSGGDADGDVDMTDAN